MTTTPPEAPHEPAPADAGPRATREEVRDLGRLRRSVHDRKVAGVAGGLARHLDIDPVILRVAFVVLVFFGGAGLILYGACWLLVPEEGRPGSPLGLDERSRSVALVIVGAIAALALVGDSWGGDWFPWPIAIVALVALLFLTRKDRRSPSGPATAPAPEAYAATPSYAVPTTVPTTAPPTAPYAQAPATGWVPPTPVAAPRPRNPRKRGPILFWFTLALIALAEGVLGIVDLAGLPVTDSAYPALAVALTGVMLLVGAFFGRAGGLILVGLVSTLALAVTTAASEWETDTVLATPTSAAAVADGYHVEAGELVLDLRQVRDLDALDGRTIELSGNVGHLEVIMPPGVDTRIRATVDGPGGISFFDGDSGGIGTTVNRVHDGGNDVPEITVVATLDLGGIEVHQ
ncbi:PspC domain-containing protein [Nocardioides sp. KIGAM211]|uniref:PspC domain-containing protein n=1 Tax=Nocardioides luti TaxID=2761101 RepID=A0A7X0RKD0_9ACTN|nr:PspC domain-containing protein [Nocardioides luti]MBB6628850.1 PspC domain-containing protein [Nocardioides luti]